MAERAHGLLAMVLLAGVLAAAQAQDVVAPAGSAASAATPASAGAERVEKTEPVAAEGVVRPERVDKAPKNDRAEDRSRPARDERPPNAAAALATATPQEAEVVLANRTVTVLRGTFYGVGPEGRAKRAELALHEIAAQGGEGKVTVRAETQGHVLLVDGQLALILIAEDADRAAGQTLGQASSAARAALQIALQETREGRQLQRLVRDGLISLLATLIAVSLVLLARWLRARLCARLERSIARGPALVRVGGVPMLHTDRLIDITRVVVGILYWTVVLIVAYQWLSFVLSQFPYTRPWGERLTQFLIDIVAKLGGEVLRAMPGLIVALLIFVIARGVIALSRPIFARVASSDQRGGWLDADTVRPTERLFRLGVALFALVMAYPYLPGSGSEAFKGVSVLIGLMLTLGGSSVVAQSVSGLVLIYSRTLRVGEYVRIDGHEGTVTQLGTFTTRLRTGMGDELTLPNTLVLGTVTRNFSREASGNAFVAETRVSIGYDTPWRQVDAMLVDAALRTPGVRAEPPPRVFHTALADFYPEYRLVCHATPTDPFQRAELLSVLRARIQDVCNENGVQIMSPHYLGDPAEPKVIPPDAWNPALVPRPPGAGGDLATPRPAAPPGR